MTRKDTGEVKTAKGTVIRRCRPIGVGKMMGSNLYLHRDYIKNVFRIFPLESWLSAISLFGMSEMKWDYRCAKLDLDRHSVRLDESPDFDSAREPHVGRWFYFSSDPRDVSRFGNAVKIADKKLCMIRTGHSGSIWHHRWAWVKPEYQGGWDVREAENWSRTYLSILKEAPSGSRRVWECQLASVGLR